MQCKIELIKVIFWSCDSPKGCVISTGAEGGMERSVKNRFLRCVPTCVGTPVGMTMGGCVPTRNGTLVRLGRALGRNDGRGFGEYVGWAGFLPMRFGLRDIYFLYVKLSVVFG